MTRKTDRKPELVKVALRDLLIAALADAGFGNLISSDFVRITDNEVSFAPMSFSSAQAFTNQLHELARTMTEPTALATDKASRSQLTIAFEECHTVPTGYSPARIFQKVTT